MNPLPLRSRALIHHRLTSNQAESLLHNLNQTSLLSSGQESMVLPVEWAAKPLEPVILVFDEADSHHVVLGFHLIIAIGENVP